MSIFTPVVTAVSEPDYDFNSFVAPVSLQGPRITLLPLQPSRDAQTLFAIQHLHHTEIFQYFPYDGFPTLDAYLDFLAGPQMRGTKTALPFAILDTTTTPHTYAGSVTIMDVDLNHRRAEIGHIWFDPRYQRTHANTETNYLLLCHLFEGLGYGRVQWKTHHGNVKSQDAAKRLGFTYEGTLRNHMISKGQPRNTVMFSIVAEEWPEVKKNLEEKLVMYGPVDGRK